MLQKINEIIPITPVIQAMDVSQIAQERKTRDYWLRVAGKTKNAYMPSKTVEVPYGVNALPDFARFRMAVRFDNGKCAYYPSYDHQYMFQDKKKIQIYDEQIGLEKLFALVAKESPYWAWSAISIFVNVTDKWANRQEKRYHYRLCTWKPSTGKKNFMQLYWHEGRLDLPYMEMYIAQNNIKGFSTAEERAPWEAKKIHSY